MKLIPINFITLNYTDIHLSHAYQMHIYAYIQRVCDAVLYSGIQGQRNHLWTLMDPNLYMHHVDILSHYSSYFSSLIFSQKTLSSPTLSTIVWHTFPIITASYMSSSPYILLFIIQSPVICKDFSPLVYMYKSSRYYAVFHINLGPMFPQSTPL